MYEPCPEFYNSDHKPIRGAFSIVTNKNNYNKKIFKEPMKCHIFISNLSCNSLNAKCFEAVTLTAEEKEQHKQQTYSFNTVFLTSPIELLKYDENVTETSKFPTCHKSHKSKGTIDSIVWDHNEEDDDIHLILSDPSIKTNKDSSLVLKDVKTDIEYSDAFLDGSFLYISLIQKEYDIIIGTATIDLQAMNHARHASTNTPAAYHAEREDFSWGHFYSDELQPTLQLQNCPLRKNGVIQGYISCSITMVWYLFVSQSSTHTTVNESDVTDNSDRGIFGERRDGKKKKKWYKKVNKYLGLANDDKQAKKEGKVWRESV